MFHQRITSDLEKISQMNQMLQHQAPEVGGIASGQHTKSQLFQIYQQQLQQQQELYRQQQQLQQQQQRLSMAPGGYSLYQTQQQPIATQSSSARVANSSPQNYHTVSVPSSSPAVRGTQHTRQTSNKLSNQASQYDSQVFQGQYQRVIDGVTVRSPDGVHFSPLGGSYLAPRVYPVLVTQGREASVGAQR